MSVKQCVEKTKELMKQACEKSDRNIDDVTIVGVTKYVDGEKASEIVEAGITNIGENRLEKLREKQQYFGNEELIWHFIGSLQTRKVKDVIPHIDYLHSLDRLSLADEIQKRATSPLKCFLQVKTSYEESKHGVKVTEALDIIKKLKDYSNIEIVGLMTMAPNTEDRDIIRNCFKTVKELQKEIQELHQENAPCTELSMGMSNDFDIAIEEGATYIRLGSILFGQ